MNVWKKKFYRVINYYLGMCNEQQIVTADCIIPRGKKVTHSMPFYIHRALYNHNS